MRSISAKAEVGFCIAWILFEREWYPIFFPMSLMTRLCLYNFLASHFFRSRYPHVKPWIRCLLLFYHIIIRCCILLLHLLVFRNSSFSCSDYFFHICGSPITMGGVETSRTLGREGPRWDRSFLGSFVGSLHVVVFLPGALAYLHCRQCILTTIGDFGPRFFSSNLICVRF